MRMMILLVVGLGLALGVSKAEARSWRGHPALAIPRTGCSDPIMRPCHGMSIFSTSKEVAKIDIRRRNIVSHETARSTPPTLALHRRLPIPHGLAAVLRSGAGRAAGVVRSASGAVAHVAPVAAARFQCFVDRLERQGYPIRFMGGWRAHGSVRHSLHPSGLALDINQIGRNRTRPRMPGNEIALAQGCGLVAGAQWRGSPDSGHVQIGGWTGRRERRHRAHYASAP